MKKIFFSMIMILLAGYTQLQAQDHREEITSQINVYFQATEEKDWEKVMDMIYPKLFDMVPREQMIQLFQDMESEGMSFSMGKMEVLQISDIEKTVEEQYALVDYAANMKIRFSGETYGSPEMMDLMKASFEDSYGEENVVFDEENSSFDIDLEKEMFAIADKGSKDWKFVEYNKDQAFLMEQLVPEEIRKKFD